MKGLSKKYLMSNKLNNKYSRKVVKITGPETENDNDFYPDE